MTFPILCGIAKLCTVLKIIDIGLVHTIYAIPNSGRFLGNHKYLSGALKLQDTVTRSI